MEKAEALSSFCLSFHKLFFPHLSMPWTSRQRLGGQSPSHGKRRLCLRAPEDLDKSRGPQAVHGRVLRDLADRTVRALSIWQLWQSCEAPRDWREKGLRTQGFLIAPSQYLKQIY